MLYRLVSRQASDPGKPISRAELLETWDGNVTESTVNGHLSHLRTTLDQKAGRDDGDTFVSHARKKAEYSLNAPVTRSSSSRPIVTYLGDVLEALKYLNGRLAQATRIEDTTIRWNVSPSLYRNHKELDRYVATLIASKATIVSITGPITDAGHANALREVHEGRRGKRIELLRMKHTAPIMNFVLLTYPDETVEVLFGYGTRRGDLMREHTAVFSSTDDRLVKEFQRLFRSLTEEDYSYRIDVEDLTLLTQRDSQCDVLSTFEDLPVSRIRAELAVCKRHIRLCAVQLPALDWLLGDLTAVLQQNRDVTVAIWEPDDPFVHARGLAIAGNENFLVESIRADERILRAMKDFKTLKIVKCKGHSPVTLVWIDNLMFFGNYWIGQNASTGPHFLVDEESATGRHLADQFFKMVPERSAKAV